MRRNDAIVPSQITRRYSIYLELKLHIAGAREQEVNTNLIPRRSEEAYLLDHSRPPARVEDSPMSSIPAEKLVGAKSVEEYSCWSDVWLRDGSGV